MRRVSRFNLRLAFDMRCVLRTVDRPAKLGRVKPGRFTRKTR